MVHIKTLLRDNQLKRNRHDYGKGKKHALGTKHGSYCIHYRNGNKECMCEMALVWHKYNACYFGMLDPMAREVIKKCTCKHE